MWLSIIFIWGIFTLIFLALGYFHWKMAGKSVSHFQITSQTKQQGVEFKIVMAGINFTDFVDKFNRYIDYYNQTSKEQNKAQAIGYWVASVIAFFSLVLAW